MIERACATARVWSYSRRSVRVSPLSRVRHILYVKDERTRRCKGACIHWLIIMRMLYVSCQHASAKQGGLCSPCQGSSAALARPQRGAVLCTGTIHQEFSSPDTAVGLISIQSICTGISEAAKESVRGTDREGKASLRNSL